MDPNFINDLSFNYINNSDKFRSNYKYKNNYNDKINTLEEQYDFDNTDFKYNFEIDNRNKEFHNYRDDLNSDLEE